MDFLCGTCAQGFELKSKKGAFGPTVPDGAYVPMLTRIRSGQGANLILLSYTDDYRIRSVLEIPSRFLIEEIIAPRKPLGSHCRRAGWQGCNIKVGLLPSAGRIDCVHDFLPIPQDEIGRRWKETAFLDGEDSASRSWLAVTMGMVARFNAEAFSLTDLYRYEDELARLFPNNRNIRAKIRQQLQTLKERGWLIFLGKGRYVAKPSSLPPR